ncbi:MAG: hypothetical protein IT429_26255 [Gemmataceae bacterium]|nr:hypothetical protein [Gemmataceae bacterium]
MRTGWLAVLVIGGWLVGSPGAGAGWLFHRNCPPSSYSPLHYWLPGAYTARANLHPQRGIHYPTDHYPGLPVAVTITGYPCPPVSPAALYGHSPYAIPVNSTPVPTQTPATERRDGSAEKR